MTNDATPDRIIAHTRLMRHLRVASVFCFFFLLTQFLTSFDMLQYRSEPLRNHTAPYLRIIHTWSGSLTVSTSLILASPLKEGDITR
ncbi:hypothetical protein QBC43DRAFT_65627 [Cladorrhinum sp. PSN259]|nr:hypothetical protein QBC43DRAFT_65627 [Cladorrhinum sp. PSN259]